MILKELYVYVAHIHDIPWDAQATHRLLYACLRHFFALGSKSRNFSVEQCVEISGIFHTSFLIHPHFSSKINAEHDKCYFCYVSGLTTLHLL